MPLFLSFKHSVTVHLLSNIMKHIYKLLILSNAKSLKISILTNNKTLRILN